MHHDRDDFGACRLGCREIGLLVLVFAGLNNEA